MGSRRRGQGPSDHTASSLSVSPVAYHHGAGRGKRQHGRPHRRPPLAAVHLPHPRGAHARRLLWRQGAPSSRARQHRLLLHVPERGQHSQMAKRKRSSKEQPNGAMVKRKSPRLELSDLPMDILCCIVSQLQMKEAARTSILSKKWKYVWCSLTNLEFSFGSMMPWGYDLRHPTLSQEFHDFIERVDAVLKQHSGVGVEKMEIQYGLKNEHADHIDRWFSFAIASKTKQLILDFRTMNPIGELYKFPFHLFDGTSSSHLQHMKLYCVSLEQPANFNVFLNLKRLELVLMDITDDELQVLLSNCHVLEFLGIACCDMLTRLGTLHPSNHLKHLQLSDCSLLQEVELSSGLATLEYQGPLIPLAPPGTLTNLCIKSSDIRSALVYAFTELPSTLPRLEMLTLKCEELERATLPDRLLKFMYLRHLRLEITFFSVEGRCFFPNKRKTDVLDFASLLEAAPFMEKLEFHMWMDFTHKPYRKHHGELRILPPRPHSHLKLVDITGFYGEKDQLEMALHILRNSVVLEAMKIDPKPMVAADYVHIAPDEGPSFIKGYRVAKKYLRKADHRGVVDLVKVRHRDLENKAAFQIVDPGWIELLSLPKSPPRWIRE